LNLNKRRRRRLQNVGIANFQKKNDAGISYSLVFKYIKDRVLGC